MINIIKVLGTYARGGEYEALYLFWLGLSTASSAEKTKLLERKKRRKRAFRDDSYAREGVTLDL